MTGNRGELSRNVVYEGDIVSDGHVVNVTDVQDESMKRAIWDYDANIENVYVTREMTINGHKYRNGVCLLVDWDDIGNCEFVVIASMFVSNADEKMFFVNKTKNLGFEVAKNSYKIKKSDNSYIVNFKQLKNTWPLPIYSENESLYVVNRYCHFTSMCLDV